MHKLTVIVPNFNHARYLRQRIDSILAQTWQDFELLLMDDCSTDDSVAILKSYAGEARVRLVCNPSNSGSPFKQWNKGVALAAGELIWLAESDDYADARFLEHVVPVLDENSKVGLAYCESKVIDESGAVLRTTHDAFIGSGRAARWHADFIADGRDECRNVLVRQNMIPNASAVVFRRSLFNQVGGADESMRLCGDWKLWAKMLLRADLGHIAKPLNYYRTHGQNVRSTTRPWQYLMESVQVVKFIAEQIDVSPDILMGVEERFADAWVSAWLWRDASDVEMRGRASEALRGLDRHFRVKVAKCALRRAATVARSGKAGRWAAHLLGGEKR